MLRATRERPGGEVRRLVALALPVAATQVSTFLLGFVDTIMVGRVSTEALAAVAIANVWNFGTLLFAHGVVSGIDPVVAQAHGARDGARCGLALQHGLVLGAGLSVIVGVAWLYTDAALIFLGQDPELAAIAQQYSLARLPGIPAFLAYSALRQYLQGRELVRPALWVVLFANVVNVVANYVLIFGALGVPALGVVGAGLATSITRVLSLLGLVGFVWWFRLHADGWQPWSRAALDVRALLRVTAIGVPIAVQMASEIWAFQAATLIVGGLGPARLAAHAATMNLAGLAFMIPLGIGQGATTRVGNLLGAGEPARAQRVANVAIVLGAGVMTVSALYFVTLRHWLPLIFTNDVGVIALAGTIMPIAGAFQIFDGTQAVACGVLRGMGHTRPAAAANVLGYWAIGLPAGYLALRSGFGIEGVWWGLCLGLGIVATVLVFWVRLRGPATVTRLVLD